MQLMQLFTNKASTKHADFHLTKCLARREAYLLMRRVAAFPFGARTASTMVRGRRRRDAVASHRSDARNVD